MRERFYLHLIYSNPSVYDYEFILDLDDVVCLGAEILKYLDLYYYELIDLIDFGEWDSFLIENGIAYDIDENHFPYKLFWGHIKDKLSYSINSNDPEQLKYNAIEQAVTIFMDFIDYSNVCNSGYLIEVYVFRDSRSFSKHFFSYLSNGIESNNNYNILKRFRDRILTIQKLIETRKFPKNDFEEGILSEWVEIYRLLYEG